VAAVKKNKAIIEILFLIKNETRIRAVATRVESTVPKEAEVSKEAKVSTEVKVPKEAKVPNEAKVKKGAEVPKEAEALSEVEAEVGPNRTGIWKSGARMINRIPANRMGVEA